jgi:hypothetical protein
LLLAQNATLANAGTLQSLSFYVRVIGGDLRLGIYNAAGPGGGPGAKLAETGSFTPVAGWNTQPVLVPVALAPGVYWLAYLPQSSALGFWKGTTTGVGGKYYSVPFGALPATFSTAPASTPSHWSMYGTVQ